jgi:hypothetical protein
MFSSRRASPAPLVDEIALIAHGLDPRGAKPPADTPTPRQQPPPAIKAQTDQKAA